MFLDNVELHNIAELVEPEDGSGRYFSRIPNDLRLRLPGNDRGSALCPAGSEVRCNLVNGSLTLVLRNEGVDTGVGILEVYQGPFFVSWHYLNLKPQATRVSVSLPANIERLCAIGRASGASFDARLTRILLPHTPKIRLMELQAPSSATPARPGQVPSLRYLAYGSSITHGNGTVEPTGGFPMRTAQLLGADLINLGFGSGGCVQPEMADYIAQRSDWDFATLELGTNCVGGKVAEFEERVRHMLASILKADARRFVFCIDILPQGGDVEGGKVAGANARRPYRETVRKIVRDIGRPAVVYVDSRKISPDPLGLSADLLHPSQIGMEQIARNLARIIRRHLPGKPGKGQHAWT